ncbi:hypothetical protein CAter282_2386 [Collimonas arenae]|uniref:Uncharacterized protein n=1 Tax=Collimonas arenae TaxID=279058 RepID=A0A127QKJ8_9BURK|nr:hypothetical protein CAter10_2627 [Collimonas arenae]AMP10132.1 hypothetical protein CAter282_2386 [Collimonas arenae]
MAGRGSHSRFAASAMTCNLKMRRHIASFSFLTTEFHHFSRRYK